MNLVWNVYHYNFNLGKIETFNIFDHYRFSLNIHKALKQCETKECFAEIVKKELMYYFWSKSEYEIIIDGWISRNNSPQKIDIYEQVLMNFDVFVDYVWGYKKRRK